MRVTVYLKAGQSFQFTCDDLEIELAPDGQHIDRISWENAEPAIRFLHLDNAAAILTEED